MSSDCLVAQTTGQSAATSPLEGRADLIGAAALSRLHDALLVGEPSGRLLQMLRRADAWLDQALADVPDARDADPELAGKALVLLRAAALRTMGLAPGPDWPQRAASFDARVHTPDEAVALARYQHASAITAALGPAAAGPPNPEPDETELRAAMDRLYVRQVELQRHTMPGDLKADALDRLDELMAEYRAWRSGARPDNPALVYLCFFAASAAFALGRGRALSGELRRASTSYAESAVLYAEGEEPDQSEAAQEEAERTRFAADADVDGASMADLRRVADGVADPVERARTLMRLAERATEANDAFSALTHAEAALNALAEAGFATPRPGVTPAGEFATTIDGWVAQACARASGAGIIRLLSWVGTTVLRAAEFRARVHPDALGAEGQAAFDQLADLLRLVVKEPLSIRSRLRTSLAAYGIDTAPEQPSDAGPTPTERATALLRRIGELTDAITSDTSSARSMEADALVAEAAGLGMPALVAQAYTAQAMLRLNQGDGLGCAAAAQDGEAALLPGGAQPASLIGQREFDLWIELRRWRLDALSAVGDHAAVFECAWSTVQAIEAARYRVSDPFQQASFLAQRTEFYVLASLSALKLERWDDLLTAMDLFKARSALRNRLATAPDADADSLALELAGATQALAAAPAEKRPALVTHRRALWDLLTVTRLRHAKAEDLPVLSVAAVQAALTGDEAAVSWVFLAPGVLIVLAIDRWRLHAERILMTDDQQALLAEYISAVRAGQVNNRAFGPTVATLSAVLLPEAIRAFVAAAKRLILSPHRELNLLPFHAARVDDGYLIERASVRYAPNLGSLLLPWQGRGSGVAAIGLDRTDLPGWEPLHAAEAEARDVADIWAGLGQSVDCLAGADATGAGVSALDLAARRCIHIATHGSSVFAGDARDDPFESYLVLRDGKLDALSLSQMRLQAEIVVMSACNSGQRALSVRGLGELPGDDLFGLQAALFQAGAQSVIGALWQLPDESARRMVPQLHKGLATGLAPDLALQAALVGELAKSGPGKIYQWAPLFLSSMGREAATGVTP